VNGNGQGKIGPAVVFVSGKRMPEMDFIFTVARLSKTAELVRYIIKHERNGSIRFEPQPARYLWQPFCTSRNIKDLLIAQLFLSWKNGRILL